MNGILLINKPVGKTSHDIVAKVRRLANTRRVGHTGTLDPLASGVLPICIGSATKASDMMTSSDKRYTAELVLGMTTDTLDAEGDILTECSVTCTEEEITRVVQSFKGDIEQIPPMYSAIKQNGKKLYELAREGKVVERAARKVKIYDINIINIDMEKQTVVIDVVCSKGTYIRTLCDDIGKKLGTGAYMNNLVRTRSGGFDISECFTLEALERENCIEDAVIPTDRIFKEYPAAVLNKIQAERIKNGVFVSCRGISDGLTYRVYDETESFLCIAVCEAGRLHIVKSFWN